MNSTPFLPPDSLLILQPDASFFKSAAEALLAFAASGRAAGQAENDLSCLRVIVPSLDIAAQLRRTLADVCAMPLLLPEFSTLEMFAQNAVDVTDMPELLAKSERRLLLYEALRRQKWFDENALWAITAEMDALFDELTMLSVRLPETQAELTTQLETAYAIRASSYLAFETQVIHEIWRALTSLDQPDATSIYHFKLARLAEQALMPLFVLLDAKPDMALYPAEYEFLLRYMQRAPLQMVCPATRHEGESMLMRTLACAWPERSEASLYERARVFAETSSQSPLADRLRLIACDGPEKEAQAVVAQVSQWLLEQDVRRIALIAQDRQIARRVRALLEREQILVVDETGWKLSTSRAAATVDALVEIVAGKEYYRNFLDLCKSPFVFADLPDKARRQAVFALEQVIRRASVKMGLTKIRQALADEKEIDAATAALATTIIERIEAAANQLHGAPASLAHWLERLDHALEFLGTRDTLQKDAAGKNLLALFATRCRELGGNHTLFRLEAWREWLNGELESAYFRDETIISPIVLTSLKAAALRPFDAALVMGGDAQHMSVAAGSDFFNLTARRELGLPLPQQAQERQRHVLSVLMALVPRITVTWQTEQNGEANLLAPEFSLLSTLHQMLWQDDLRLKEPLPVRRGSIAQTVTQPVQVKQARPVVPSADLPQKISVSAYATLVACPYRFFARHVLGLGEMDEVSETMAKNDYGALVHRALERFHRRYPQVSALAGEEALAALKDCVSAVFAPAIAENFRSTAWFLRLEKRLPAYIEWQCEQERQGWRYVFSETGLTVDFTLENVQPLTLYGRVDRLDVRQSPQNATMQEYRLLDYKTQTAKAIKDRLGDDIQLPAYALLYSEATEAAYVALDDELIQMLSSSSTPEDLHHLAALQRARLTDLFNQLHAGSALPAHGAEKVCQWCEMQGLCRRAHVDP